MAEEYIYAVSRIHANESRLLSFADIEQLLSCKTYDESIKVLVDKGFGGNEAFDDYEELLNYENARTWQFVAELFDDLSVFDALRLPNDFHNLKASIKRVCADAAPEKVLVFNGTLDAMDIYNADLKQDYSALPLFIKSTADKARDALLKLRDGQLCDVIIDRAQLAAMLEASKNSNCDFIEKYADLYVAQSNVKIAVRAIKTSKQADFFDMALCPCKTLDIEKLKNAALEGMDSLYDYLLTTEFEKAVEFLKKSPCEFEKFFDNYVMESIKSQKYNSFGLAPAAAYILARENEIKALRIVLCAKKNSLNEKSVRERLRDMYV